MWLGEASPEHSETPTLTTWGLNGWSQGQLSAKLLRLKFPWPYKISGLFQFVSVVFLRPLKFFNSLAKGWNWGWPLIVKLARGGKTCRTLAQTRNETSGKSKWTRGEVFWRRLRCGIVCQVLAFEGKECSWIFDKEERGSDWLFLTFSSVFAFRHRLKDYSKLSWLTSTLVTTNVKPNRRSITPLFCACHIEPIPKVTSHSWEYDMTNKNAYIF